MNESGLYTKYLISKADGSPTDPKADYFVLRLDTDPAARAAAYVYAREVEESLPGLAAELLERIEWFDFGEPYLKSLEHDEIWEVRARALLPILQAAIDLTQGVFDLKGSSTNQTIVPAKQYEVLRQVVTEYLKAAKQEGDRDNDGR